MKKITSIILLFSAIAIGQTRKQLQTELYNYSKGAVMNKAFDKPFDEVWNAVYIVQTKEYPIIKRQDKKDAIIEGESNTDKYRELLGIEIIGKGPYRLALHFKQQVRADNGGWYDTPMIPEDYSYRIQFQIYQILYGAPAWPQDLADRINAYNSKQKKDKNRIVKGVDW